MRAGADGMISAVLQRVFGAGPNELRFAHGHRRRLVDGLMGAQIARHNARHFLGLGPKLLGVGRRLASQKHLTKAYKPVYFNGRIYVDCFYPGFPGPVFDRLVTTLTRNLALPAGQWPPSTFALVLSMTKKCVYRCEHCYAIESLGSRDVISLAQLRRIAWDFRRLGVGVIAWEGGEPLLRFDDLVTLIRELRHETEALIATTAYGLTPDKAAQLREAGLVQAIISLDHWEPDKHNAFRRNKKAFDMAVNGIRIFREAGVLPSLCICATREVVDSGGLYEYLELARELGAAFVQILDATPSGNYLGEEVALSDAQLEAVKRFHREVNTGPRYRDYPSISARALLEDDDHYGCTAGNSLCYVDSSGHLQACDLLQISFGNVLEEGTDAPYGRMKQWFPHMIAGRCPAQTLCTEIAAVHAEAVTLPLSHEDCEHVLEAIRRRGPARFAR